MHEELGNIENFSDYFQDYKNNYFDKNNFWEIFWKFKSGVSREIKDHAINKRINK